MNLVLWSPATTSTPSLHHTSPSLTATSLPPSSLPPPFASLSSPVLLEVSQEKPVLGDPLHRQDQVVRQLLPVLDDAAAFLEVGGEVVVDLVRGRLVLTVAHVQRQLLLMLHKYVPQLGGVLHHIQQLW